MYNRLIRGKSSYLLLDRFPGVFPGLYVRLLFMVRDLPSCLLKLLCYQIQCQLPNDVF